MQKWGVLEAPPKRQFKEDYGVFRFGQFKSVWNWVGKSTPPVYFSRSKRKFCLFRLNP